MLVDFYATKLGMTQVWSQSGKRIPATRLKVDDLMVIDFKKLSNQQICEVGIGRKKLKNAPKPLKAKLEKSGFSFAPLKIKGIKVIDDSVELKPGDSIAVNQVIEVGDIVDVQGTSKGRGFAGGMKRHGFHGGPKTHGQSDRARAIGSIGAGTTPGRVLKGHRMPGHYGVETKTVKGLTVLFLDEAKKELLVSGPVPGHFSSIVRLRKTGSKKVVELLPSSLKTLGLLKEEKKVEKTEAVDNDKEAKPEVKEKSKAETKS